MSRMALLAASSAEDVNDEPGEYALACVGVFTKWLQVQVK